jgi:hypothetical protein
LSTGTYITYQWLFGGFPIPGATSESYKMTINGDYSVIGINAEGCSDTSAIFYINNLAVNNPSGADTNRIVLYPNPAQTIVHVAGAEKVNIKIMSIDGKLLRELHNAKDIDISDFADGVYLIEVYDMQGVKLNTAALMKIN